MMRSIGVIFKEEEKPKCCVVKKEILSSKPILFTYVAQ